jgi:hypothetical protein
MAKTRLSAKSKEERSEFDVHPGVLMVQKWIADLPARTGRSLEQWLTLVRSEGPTDEKARRRWLKDCHGLGTNAAAWLAERANSGSAATAEDDPGVYLKSAAKYVREMYAPSTGKAELKPLHDALIAMGRSMGNDVRICPCKTIVPFYRHHVFAQIKPATRTRIDFGLALAKYKKQIPKRLIDTGGGAKGDRITHRIAITVLANIDDVVRKWCGTAYELDQ